MRNSNPIRDYSQIEVIESRLDSALLEKDLDPEVAKSELKSLDEKSFIEKLGRKDLTIDQLYRAVKKYDLDAHYILTGEEYTPENETERFIALFSAFNMAHTAFLALDEKGNDPDPNDKNLTKLRHAGLDLNEHGGFAAMTAAYRSFFPDDRTKTDNAGSIINTQWHGIGDWLN